MVAKKVERDERPAAPPTDFPETTPQTYPSMGYDFVLQGVFDLKGSVSKLEKAVELLESSVSEQKKEIQSVKRTLQLATGAFVVLSALATFFGNRLWDTLMDVTELLRHPPPAATAPAPAPARQ
jgi:hypothetical protein